MALKIFFVFIFVALQDGFVLSSPFLLTNSTDESKTASIPLSEFVDRMREYPDNNDTSVLQYLLMIVTASYGGRPYDLSANLSIECSRTIRASVLTLENLAVCEEAYAVLQKETIAAAQEVRNAKQLEEHPLELYCRRCEKSFPENQKLKVAFEKAKEEAAKFDFTSCSPYPGMFLKDPIMLMKKLFAVSEFSRVSVVASFVRQTNASKALSSCAHYFAKSCQAVAKSEQFAGSIQSLYEKALNETLLEISVNDRVNKSSADHDRDLFWVPTMIKTFYKYMASDANLKKELEKMAAVIGKDASKEDLDFSKCDPSLE